MRTYFLYLLKDPNLNSPKYVGVSNNPERRFKEHLKDISITKKTKWISSLKENNQIPILEIVNKTSNIREVLDWEIDYIKQYKEIYNLVNTTSRGEYYAIGTPILVFDIEGNYLETYSSMIEYAELNNLHPNSVSSISSVCLRKRNYAYNHIFRYLDDTVTKEDLEKLKKDMKHNSKKSVVIVSLSGKLLGEFESLAEASRAGFGNQNAISEALRKSGRLTVNNNFACYSYDEYQSRFEEYIKNKKVVSKYDLEGNYIDTYLSFSDAARSVNKSVQGIKECCEFKYKQAHGYQWRYGMSKENVGKYIKTYNSKNRTHKVCQYTLEGELIKIWESAKVAGETLGVRAQSINAAASGRKKTAFKYIWKYE